MIITRYAVCSEEHKKPVTRAVFDSRAEADTLLEELRRADAAHPQDAYWIAELGPECEAWRWLAPDKTS